MLDKLTTEKRNQRTLHMDKMSIEEFLHVMNDEDAKVATVIQKEIPQIMKAVEKITASLKSGGRMIYLGSGTSGRIGLLDAVECPPTFGTDPEQVLGLIAGGDQAFVKAVEGAEDESDLGVKDLEAIQLNKKDTVIGLAASGRTPYVIGGLEYAQQIGAGTVAISCNKKSEISKLAAIAIEVECGPEVLTGSTRLKAGTAQKLVCNMLSTASMIKMGKTFGNLMVDLQPTNKKLQARTKLIIMEATDCDAVTAEKYLRLANNHAKVAIVMLLTGESVAGAKEKLKKTAGSVFHATEQ